MKKNLLQIIAILSVFVLCSSSCKKNNSSNPLSQLPPATQTGANTFGCLINGKAFTPGGSNFGGPVLACYYQYAYRSPVPIDSPLGPVVGWVFNISAVDQRNSCNITGIGIGTDSIVMQQGQTYILQSGKAGQGGQYIYLNCNGSHDHFQTSDTVTGKLILKRFDLTNQIASGTFWFNVLPPNGDTIKITDGRFDVHFTE